MEYNEIDHWAFNNKCLTAKEVLDIFKVVFSQKKLTFDMTEETQYKELGSFIREIRLLARENSLELINNK